MIERNTAIPASNPDRFSKVADRLASGMSNVLLGECQMAADDFVAGEYREVKHLADLCADCVEG